MSAGERIRALRKAKDINQKQLGEIVGVSDKAVSTWELGKSFPTEDKLERLAAYFGVKKSDIREDESDIRVLAIPGIEHPRWRHVPLLGDIACGEPLLAEENIEDWMPVEVDVNCDFVLRCKGTSMAPKLMNGDMVMIRQQPDVEDGQIAAVLIGDETALKHVYHMPHAQGIQLVAENQNVFAPRFYMGEEASNVRILGKVVAYMRMVR